MGAETLARENEELKARLAQRDSELTQRTSELEERTARLQELNELLTRLKRDNALLHERLVRFLNRRYGRKGDVFDEGQLALFAELLSEDPPEEPDRVALEAPDVELPEDRPPKKARRRKTREVDYAALPREHRRHELPEAERTCPVTGKPLVPVGVKLTEELEYQPAKLFVIVHERIEYGLGDEDRCERMAPTVVAPMPVRPIENGLAGPGLLARVLVAKYVEHLPLHRQEAIFEREGLRIPRQSLCEWVMRSIELLLPIVGALKRRMLSGDVLQCDDTKVLCLQNATGGGRSWAYLWTWIGEDPDEVVYDFSTSRGHEVLVDWIGPEWTGFLVRDGYGGFGTLCRSRDAAHPIVGVGCWAHVRRKVRDAAMSAPEDAVRIAGLIGQLYAVEKEGRELGLEAEELCKLRRRKSLPVLWKIRGAVREMKKRYTPEESMGEALGYLGGQWRSLRQYVKDGRLPIDNNACERAVRPVAVGRRNWLYTGSPRGGAMGAAIYSIVESCKRAGVDPFEYLVDVLVRVHVHPASRVDELVPKRWKQLRDQGRLALLPS